jgi:hypothetical protein
VSARPRRASETTRRGSSSAAVLPVLLALLVANGGGARASEGELGRPETSPDDTSALFAAGTKALAEGRPGEAIANFEALGDRGVTGAVVSFDRGLAYAERVRGSSALPGDLGRAALGFEEARALTRDPALARDATKALGLIRAEVARRRALAGEPVEVDPGVPLGRALVALAPEDIWGGAALATAAVLTFALFLRWRSQAARVRLGAAIAISAASPALVCAVVLTLAARDERLHLREGILVSESARLSDERHVAKAGAAPLPEAARVTIEDAAGGWAQIRFGGERGWVPSPAVRPLARPE